MLERQNKSFFKLTELLNLKNLFWRQEYVTLYARTGFKMLFIDFQFRFERLKIRIYLACQVLRGECLLTQSYLLDKKSMKVCREMKVFLKIKIHNN
jgi:hypothetical protein